MNAGLPAANMTREEVLRMLRCPTCSKDLHVTETRDGAMCLWCDGPIYSSAVLGLDVRNVAHDNGMPTFYVAFQKRSREVEDAERKAHK